MTVRNTNDLILRRPEGASKDGLQGADPAVNGRTFPAVVLQPALRGRFAAPQDEVREGADFQWALS